MPDKKPNPFAKKGAKNSKKPDKKKVANSGNPFAKKGSAPPMSSMAKPNPFARGMKGY